MSQKINNVSIIIPSLGNLSNIERLLYSIDKQEIDARQLEVIVAINGFDESKDITRIEKALSQFKNFIPKLIFMKNKGVNIARNSGIHASSHDLLLFLDEDCELNEIKFISSHIKFHNENINVFAFGGGYSLPPMANFYDRIYNEIQMNWLYSGNIEGRSHKFLLGGNFSFKKELQVKYSIFFDENIIYGGSEYEFFLSVKKNHLPLIKGDLTVLHHTNESFLNLTIKIYKQGKGKSYIDLKHGEVVENHKTAHLKPILIYFNFVFWFGYYAYRKQYLAFVCHILNDLYARFQRQRGILILSFKKIIEYKKNKGDRF